MEGKERVRHPLMTPSFILDRTDPRAHACSAASCGVHFNDEEQHLIHLLDNVQRLNNYISDITLILILSLTKWVKVL